ncbi:MAG TPA: hypothetical protein VFX49_00515 [Chloroflexota bacterium]|nr:hypothetical protein [Chloroflexota bacterium]
MTLTYRRLAVSAGALAAVLLVGAVAFRRLDPTPELGLGPAAPGAPGAVPASIPASSPPPRCERLTPDVDRTLSAADPAGAAGRFGLPYVPGPERGAVWVFVVLFAPEGDLAARHRLDVRMRDGPKGMLAVAPLATLCGLANDARVAKVHAPSPELVVAAQAATPEELGRAAREGRCRGLVNNALNQLLQDPDPGAFARSAGLELRDGRVPVEGELARDTDAAAAGGWARAHGIARLSVSPSTSQYGGGHYFGAEVPVDSLCAAANDPRVLRMDPPNRPVPLGR